MSVHDGECLKKAGRANSSIFMHSKRTLEHPQATPFSGSDTLSRTNFFFRFSGFNFSGPQASARPARRWIPEGGVR